MAALRASVDPSAAVSDQGRQDGPGIPPKLALVEAVPPPPLFSPLELLVIGIGRRDRSTLLKSGSGLARLQRLLFGIEAPTPLGDPRLEALRSLVIGLRRREYPKAELAAASAAGVTPRQIEYLRSTR